MLKRQRGQTIPFVGGRRFHAQRGVAAIEFAVIVPFLILLLIGLVEVGRYAYFSILVANAARAGVQFGAQNSQTAVDNTKIQLAAQVDGANSIANLQISSDHICQCWNGVTGTTITCADPLVCASGHPILYVTVTVSGTAPSLFNYPGLPSSHSVSATETMRVADQ